MSGADLGIVIPVGPGETAWTDLLADLTARPATFAVVLVAAHGHEPAGFGQDPSGLGPRLRWLTALPGRARQLNAGARECLRPRLCFLHADSRLPARSLDALLAEPPDRDHLGYFDLRFLDDGPALMGLNSLGAWLRSRCLGLPFGDQGLVLARALLERVGGFDETLAAGEDHALVWRLRRSGVPLRALNAPLYTSARRYAQNGWLRTTVRHLRLTWQQARRFARTPARP